MCQDPKCESNKKPDAEESRKAEEHFRFWVRDWLQKMPICRRCGVLMNPQGAGVLPDANGNYPKELNVDERITYSEDKCPKCKLIKREETKHSWREPWEK